ncbi:hypothetical protein EPN15_00715 [Patescibacteria group bacterium]|nr:MAG: hypothetical protein EPN15_00715 [Patescibacteria group bacterium]
MFLATPLAFKIIYTYLPLGIFGAFFLAALGVYFFKLAWLSKILWWGIGVFSLVYVIRAAYLAWLQYVVWQGDKMGQFLLPPHQPISYFWQYVWTHFLMDLPWIFGGAAMLGIIVLVIGIISKGRMADAIDAQLAVFGALIVGWPNMLSFFLTALTITLLGGIVYGIIKRQKVVTPVTLFFFAGIIIAFFWGTKITELLGLSQLIV